VVLWGCWLVAVDGRVCLMSVVVWCGGRASWDAELSIRSLGGSWGGLSVVWVRVDDLVVGCVGGGVGGVVGCVVWGWGCFGWIGFGCVAGCMESGVGVRVMCRKG